MPKNIVLLSDGTGNSSAQLLKTNVWRVYEALQLTDPSKQVACYDDGVGTSSFRPLALLGGVFGVGLARNVLRLYRFLCEHYDPGDQIYLFGFSRGAFTIRVLVGLICDQGIIKTRPTLPVAGATPGPVVQELGSGERSALGSSAKAAAVAVGPFVFGGELVRMSRWAYRDFRKQFNQTRGLVTVARKLRNVLFRGWEALGGLRAYDRTKNHQVGEIEFVGLWDTVDAYGLPIDELTDGIDQWVWPLSMPELKLSAKVKRARHVLALDDERNTFHPVLWDESDEPQDKAHIKEERISQVWFAGMHSNVGGGYSDDALAHVSFTWMTEQAGRCGIHFVPELLDHHTAKADPLGRLYDSRSGLKGYYRYNPRRIKWLTNGQEHERGFFGLTPKKPTVTIERPKIHESVFARMAAAPEGYALIVFPDRYAVVMADGRILEGADNPYEPPAAARRRVEAQEAAWDLVWWKRSRVLCHRRGLSGALAPAPRLGRRGGEQGPRMGRPSSRDRVPRRFSAVVRIALGELLPREPVAPGDRPRRRAPSDERQQAPAGVDLQDHAGDLVEGDSPGDGRIRIPRAAAVVAATRTLPSLVPGGVRRDAARGALDRLRHRGARLSGRRCEPRRVRNRQRHGLVVRRQGRRPTGEEGIERRPALRKQ